MKPVQNLIIRAGTALPPMIIVLLIAGLNIYCGVTLDAFGRHFQQISGYLPIDLQNVGAILTAQQALEQIATYTSDTISLYWSFFILDNLMPPLVFGTFALLWVYYLKGQRHPFAGRLLNSPLLLIPLGVGLFDLIENLFFVAAISYYPNPSTEILLQAGLIFVHLKAVCLFSTFIITALLTVYHIVTFVRSRWLQPALVSQENLS